MPGSGAARHAIATNPAAAARIATVRDRRAIDDCCGQTGSGRDQGERRELRVRQRRRLPERTTTRYAASQPSSQLSSAADIGHERVEHRREEAEPEQRRHHRSRNRIRDHRVERAPSRIGRGGSAPLRLRMRPRRRPLPPPPAATDIPRVAACRRGTSVKIAATAANESWKPGSSRLYGLQASSTSAPSSRNHQRSRSRAQIHASDASAPATPARTTDGCAPTAST